MENKEINIQNEIFERYNELIPNKEIGLIVFSIYSQIKEKKADRLLSYRNLTNIIDEKWKELGINHQKGKYQKYESILLILRKHYIDKDIKTDNYILTDYAEKFCRFIEEEIKSVLKPSEIEQLFNNLLLTLKDNIVSFTKIEVWYDKEFYPRKFDINSQVRALRIQAEKAQNELNSIMNKDEDYFEMLKEIERQIDKIQKQNYEIVKSFSAKDSIKKLLDETELSEIREFRTIRANIREFFREIDKKLSIISEIIDTTKPKIFKLYQDIEKKQFDKKLEKFLLYVLKNSSNTKFSINQLKNKTIYDTNIELPQNIEFSKLNFPQIDKFIRTEYVEFTEPDTNETQEANFDPEANRLQIEKRRNQLEKNKKIEFWYNQFYTTIKELKLNEELEFSNFFYEILKTENQDIEIALKVANKVFTNFSRDDKFQLDIDRKFETSKDIKDIALWKMKITKLSY